MTPQYWRRRGAWRGWCSGSCSATPHAEPLHVTYSLPLPADGAVAGYQFRIGDRRVVGEID
jgi:hypothetical protein